MKDSKILTIYDWQYWVMIAFAVIFLFAIVTLFTNHLASVQIGYSRLGIGIGLLISYLWNCNKSKVRKIIIDENSLSFEITKNLKRSRIQIQRKDIVACKMFIYTGDNKRICLNFDLSSNGKIEFVDIYHNEITLSVIRQFFVLKEYIPSFSHDISQKNRYISSFIENGLKYSIRDKIYNTLVSISILIGVIIILYCLMLF